MQLLTDRRIRVAPADTWCRADLWVLIIDRVTENIANRMKNERLAREVHR